jgi:hypothetical protein
MDAFVGYGAAVVAGSPMMLNLGVAWTNPGATQYFVNGGPLHGANAKAFALDGKGNIVPRGGGMRDFFKSMAIETFNPLKGDCWLRNPSALLGDDDEEWYDDDAWVDDDMWEWDDDDDVDGYSVMAFGDDDERCVP